MPLPLDHIVIAVRDLAQAIEDYRALGFHVREGGRHPSPRTSRNALVVFADGAYLELIAWDGPPPGERWYDTLQAAGEGLVDFALLPPDTAAALAAAQARGLHTLRGPVDGSRQRPDGQRVQWQTARHATPDVPFLCGDITPRGLRVPEEADVRTHPNGATGVAAIAVAVRDLDATLARWRALLGPTLTAVATPLPGQGLRIAALALQGLQVVLMSPATAEPRPGEPDAATRLRERLAQRGEGPCAVTLQGTATGTLCALDPARTHGVMIELPAT